MKIAIDARFYGWEHAGLGRYTRSLIHNLTDLDNENDYLLLLNKVHFNKVKLPDNWTKIVSEHKNYTVKEQFGLYLQLNNIKPDIVHFLHLNIPIFYKGKFIVTLHDMTMHKQGRDATTMSFIKYYLKRIPYRLVFRHAVNASQKIIVPTKQVKGEIVDYYKINPGKVKVIYEGVDKKYFKTDGSVINLKKYDLEGKTYFIYTGNLYPHKNVNSAIDAIKKLNLKNSKPVYLVLVSSKNVFSERTLEYAKKIKTGEYVKFLGFVEDEHLLELYKKAVAFVFPSLSEGFGLPGLEAMAASTPVLAANIPVLKEVYKDSVLYFDPKNPNDIADVMRKVLEMPNSDRRQITAKAKIFTERYTWEKTAKETLDVYSELQNM